MFNYEFLKQSKLFNYFLAKGFLNPFLSIHYYLAVRVLKKYLYKIDHFGIYIKGSFGKEHFKLGISDIDVVFVGNKSHFQQARKIISNISKIFPQIADIDCFEKKQFCSIVKYSDLRFKSFKSWYVLSERNFNLSDVEDYLFFPLKYKIDQFSELFFQFEWFYKNLKKSSSYNCKNQRRILSKINKVLTWIEEDSTDDYNFYENKNITLNEVLKRIENSSYLKKILEKLRDHNIEGNNFFNKKDNVVIYGNRTIALKSFHEKKFDLTIPQNLYEIFLSLGILNLDSLVHNILNIENSSIKLALSLRLYGQVLLGLESKLLKEDLLSEIEHLLFQYDFKFSGNTKDLFNSKQFITVNWGEDSLRKKSMLKARNLNKKQQGNHASFHIDFNSKFEKDEKNNILFIKLNKKNEKLWHKESFFNFAAGYLFFTKSFIFSDNDIYSDDESWLNKSFEKIEKAPDVFIQCFSKVEDKSLSNYNFDSWVKSYLSKKISFDAPGLVWGMSRQLYLKIDGLQDDLIDGSNDGLLMQELTGFKMGRSSSFEWFKNSFRGHKKIPVDYVDINLTHIYHGNQRNYINRLEYLSYFRHYFSEVYSKNLFGIYEASNLEALNVLNKLCKGELDKISKEDFYLFLKNPKYTKIVLKEGFVECFNSFVVIEEKEKCIRVENRKSDSNAYIKYTPFFYKVFLEEIVRFTYKVEGDWKNSFSEVKFNNYSDGSSQNYYVNNSTNSHYLSHTFSAWEDGVLSPEITLEIPADKEVKIREVERESIHSSHAWSDIKNTSFKFEESTSYPLVDKGVMPSGWYRIEIDLDFEKEILVNVKNTYGSNLSINRTYKKSDQSIAYIFYYDENGEEMNLHLSTQEKLSGSFNVLLRRRKRILKI